MTTSIEWTQETWNPVRGCKPISPGCANCYAMRFAHRFSAPGQPYEGRTRLRSKGGPVWTGEARFVEEMLAEPLRWRTPRRVFVNSMSDLFHEDVSFEQIAAVFGVMAGCPQHTFQVLTKRPERMVEFFRWVQSQDGVPPTAVVEIMAANLCDVDQLNPPWPLSNVWLGVSVEDQRHADERIPHLLQVPASVRFLSCEPLLESVNLRNIPCNVPSLNGKLDDYFDPLAGRGLELQDDGYSDGVYPRIHWVIVGGESGYGSRPFDLAWARSIRDQCKAAKVSFFFKQAGAVSADAGTSLKLRSRKGNDLQEIPEDLRVREWPEVPR